MLAWGWPTCFPRFNYYQHFEAIYHQFRMVHDMGHLLTKRGELVILGNVSPFLTYSLKCGCWSHNVCKNSQLKTKTLISSIKQVLNFRLTLILVIDGIFPHFETLNQNLAWLIVSASRSANSLYVTHLICLFVQTAPSFAFHIQVFNRQ